MPEYADWAADCKEVIEELYVFVEAVSSFPLGDGAAYHPQPFPATSDSFVATIVA